MKCWNICFHIIFTNEYCATYVHVGIDNNDNGVQNTGQRWLVPPPETGHIAGNGGEACKRNGAAAIRPKSSKLLQNPDDHDDDGDDDGDDGDDGDNGTGTMRPKISKLLQNHDNGKAQNPCRM